MPMDERILDTVWRWIEDPGVEFHCLLATDADGTGRGLMHYRPMFSPLRGTLAGFLDDLYVEPAARGSGIVGRLFEALAEQGRQQGWPVIRWITRDNNYRARAVYDRVAVRSDWITYELNPPTG